MKTLTGRTLTVWAVLVLIAACAPVGKMTHDMGSAIQNATTKADHQALAAHSEQEAKALEAKAAEHHRMAKAYPKGGGYIQAKTDLFQHCEVVAAKYEEAAKENLALAKQHRDLAAEAPK